MLFYFNFVTDSAAAPVLNFEVHWFCCLDAKWHVYWDNLPWQNVLEPKCPKSKRIFCVWNFGWADWQMYSKPPPSSTQIPAMAASTSTEERTDGPQFCYCREGEHGQMAGCNNEQCPYQWFHLNCLKLKAIPKSKTWYYPESQKRCKGKSMQVQCAD